MTPTPPPGRGPLLAFFVLTLASYAFFYQGGGTNQFTRLGLALSLVERGSVNIDTYEAWTFDKALKDGHYYCDKAPGLSLLAVPVYALLRPAIERAAGAGSRNALNLSLYVTTVLAVSLPVAVAMTAFYRRAWLEAGPRTAFWVSVALALGSPLAVYASLFYAHALCAGLAWLAYALLTSSPEDAVIPTGRAAAAGLLAGWATLSEFPVALITGLLFAYLCLHRPRSWRAPAAFVLGGLPTLAILLVYNVATFGSPLASGYRYIVTDELREAMTHGIMGVTGPTVGGAFAMFFLPFRGLLWFWPFFIAVPLALPLLWEQQELRGRVLLAAVIMGVYLLFGCSYFLWTGGSAYGPRHVIPCLPFAAYLVVRAVSPLLLRVVVPVATVVSVFLALMAVSTMAEFPEPRRGEVSPEVLNPLFRIAWPRFERGALAVKVIGEDGLMYSEPIVSDLPVKGTSVLGLLASASGQGPVLAASRLPPGGGKSPGDPRFYDACNLGQLAGLGGLASLIPLVIILWAGLGGYLWWSTTRQAGSVPERSPPVAPGSPVR